ncbi:MAG: HDOD domain-containing protein [bacterium]
MPINRELKAVIDSTCDLPPMPLVANRIVSLASDPNTDARVLERAILADQALTAKILKIANSSFYGCIRAINTLAAAIVLIGFKGIRTLALAASLESFYRRINLIEKMLWEHSVASAIAAHILSQKLHCHAEEAFIGGLMHDIGKVILNNQLNEDFSEIVQVAYNEDIPFVEAEREKLGFTHAEVGGLIVQKWNLSKDLEEAVTYHHNLDGVDPLEVEILKFAALLNLSDAICIYLGIGYRQPRTDIDFQALKSVQILGITGLDILQLAENVKTSYEAEKGNFS